MTEFRFDIKPLFPQPIVKVSSNLLPHTFRGDRRQVLDATTKISEIIDIMGQLSAVAQKLNTPVTTAQRLRLSENQRIYLMADVSAGHNGMLLGLLKVGTKDLYLFDEAGNSRKVDNTPCILDFYIHESRQRSGLGRQLFEVMLAEENWKAINCSIDRPSAKLMGFCKKYYGLERTIPQANNFVIFDGFFEQLQQHKPPLTNRSNGGDMYITNSPNTQLFGAHFTGGDLQHSRRIRQNDFNNLSAQLTQITPTGRYGAPRPVCSMGEIIHAGAPKCVPPKTSSRRDSGDLLSQIDIDEMNAQIEQQLNLQEQNEFNSLAANEKRELAATPATAEREQQSIDNGNVAQEEAREEEQEQEQELEVEVEEMKYQKQTTQNNIYDAAPKMSNFHLSKQHTGMKNRSFGVGMAVTPTQKMEFNQEQREDFGVVKINRPVGKLHSPTADNVDNMSTTSSNGGLTEQGYHDLKFYHNRLW